MKAWATGREVNSSWVELISYHRCVFWRSIHGNQRFSFEIVTVLRALKHKKSTMTLGLLDLVPTLPIEKVSYQGVEYYPVQIRTVRLLLS